MKRVLIEDDKQSGLDGMLGETVLLICSSYFYHGTLTAVGDVDIELSDAGIVYETGNWSEDGFADKQNLPNTVYVTRQSVESYVQI